MRILVLNDPDAWPPSLPAHLEARGHQLVWITAAQPLSDVAAECDVCLVAADRAEELPAALTIPAIAIGAVRTPPASPEISECLPLDTPAADVERTVRLVVQREQAMAALRRIEERYRVVLDQVPALIWSVDRSLIIRYVRGRALTSLGISADDAVGRSFRDFFPARDDERPIRELLAALDGVTSTYRMSWAGIEWDSHLEPLTDAAGAIVGVVGVGVDVSGLRDAEDRAGRLGERYRHLFESSRDAITISRADGQLLDANDAALALFGYSRDELHDLNARTRWVDVQERDRLLSGAPAGIKDCPVQFFRRDGTIIECLVSASQTDEGELLSIIRDVTAENAARRELKDVAAERERISVRLREFIQNLPGVVWELRVDGPGQHTVTLGTGKSTDFLGHPFEEWVGSSRQWMDLVHPDDQPRAAGLMQAILGGDRIQPPELRMRTRDGSYVWTEVRAFPVPNEDGRIVALQGMLLDIGSRKSAQQALARRTELLDRIVQNLPVAIATLDPQRRIDWVNPAWRHVLGWGTAEIGGRDPFPLLFGDRDVARLATPSDPPRWIELETLTSAGEQRRLSWTHLELAGEAALLIGVDTTEQHELQARLAQAAKMEAIGRLAGGVAHDFNNLLTVVLGSVDLLMDGSENPAEDLAEIRRAAERAALLTRQLLTFSRRQVLQPRTLDLNAVLRNVERMLTRIVGEDAELRPSFSAGPLLVRADAGQLEQVITNLVVNARDAMPGGGTITVEIGEIELDDDAGDLPAGRYASLSVIDHGIGIPSEVREHIFEPFFTTKGAAGTGLGLATVYGIVAQAGGDVRVESAPGAGSRFEVLLPLADAASDLERPDQPRLLDRGQETLLVVEDEPAVLGLVRTVLAHAGYTVLTASTIEEVDAVMASGHAAIDLLLTDVVMPATRGDLVAARVLQSSPKTSVLYMSGYSDGQLPPAVTGGTVNLLAKPFSNAELLRTVRSLLDRRRTPSRGD